MSQRKSFVPSEKDLSRRAILDDLDKQLKVQAARLHKLEERTRIVPPEHSDVTKNLLNLTSYECLPLDTANDSDDEPLVVKLSRQVKLSRTNAAAAALPVNGHQNGDDLQVDALQIKKKPRHVVKKYDPSYTWNRGGRMKELRTRYRARKFFYLWRERCLGRVLPSRAVQFYNQHLKQRVWTIWLCRYWMDYKEVRLNLRAEGHYRFLLTSRCLTAWLSLISHRRSVTAKIKLALKWHETATLRRLFLAWRSLPGHLLAQRELSVRAEEFHNHQMKRQSWSRWCHAMGNVKAWNEREEEANSLYENKLKSRCLSQWRLIFQELQNSKSQMLVAVSYHNSLSKDYHFRCWQLYVGNKRKKATVKKRSELNYRHCLLHRFYQTWLKSLGRHRELQAMEEKRLQLHNQSITRLVMERWKFYITIRDYEADHRRMAESHYQLALKRRMLHRLVQFLCLQQKKHDLGELAVKYYRRKLLHRSYDKWVDKMDDKEENKLFNKTRIARASRRRMLLRVHFAQWREFVWHERQKKVKMQRAESHFHHTALPQCFNQWKLYTALRMEKLELKQKAEEHFRRNIESIVWENWRGAVEMQCEHRYLERVAVLHDRSRVIRSVLHSWLKRARTRLEENAAVNSADYLRKKLMLKTAMQNWKLFVQKKSRKRHQLALVQKFSSRHLLTSVLRRWRLLVTTHRQNRQIVSRHRQLLHSRIVREKFQCWLRITRMNQERRQLAGQLATKKSNQDLKWFWSVWKRGIEASRKRRHVTSVAKQHYERAIVAKRFHCWREYAVNHVIKKERTNDLVRIGRDRLDRSITNRYLQIWMRRRDGLVLERLAMSRSVIYCDRVCLTKCLSEWRSVVVRKQRERLLKRQADWLCEKRTLGNVWFQWRGSLSLKRHLMKQNSRALWHWSVTLQTRVWSAWRQWTLSRRRDKERENSALSTFRNGLLTRGLAQWTSVAWHLRRERERAALQTMKYLTPRQISSALKCAVHWRQVTLRRNQGAPFVTLSLRRPLVWQQQFAERPSPARLPTEVVTLNSVPPPSLQQELPCTRRPGPAVPDFMRSSLAREGLLVEEESGGGIEQEEKTAVSSQSLLNQVLEDDLEMEEDLLPPQFFLNRKSAAPIVSGNDCLSEMSGQPSQLNGVAPNFGDVKNSSIPSHQKESSRINMIRELRQIKSRLKSFNDSRQYLRSLSDRLTQLEELLIDQKQYGPSDSMVANLRAEIDSMSAEKEKLKRSLSVEKAKCKSLSVRSHQIIDLLNCDD